MPTLAPPTAFAYRLRTRMVEAATEEFDEAMKGGKPPASDVEIVVTALAVQVRDFESQWDALWQSLSRKLMPVEIARPPIEAAQRLLLGIKALLERLVASSAPFESELAGITKTLLKIGPQINELLAAMNVVVIDPERVRMGLEQARRGECEDVADIIKRMEAGAEA